MSLRKPRIIVVGATGQIGSAIFQSLEKLTSHEVVGTFFKTKSSDARAYLDLTDQETYSNIGNLSSRDVVLLLSAVAQPQKVFSNYVMANETNTRGTKKFISYLNSTGARLLFFSSVEVFDGSAAPSSETDSCNPLNEYGRQKYLVESYLQESVENSRYKILRLPWNISLNTGFHCVVENTYQAVMSNKAIFARDYLSSAISINDTSQVVKLIIENFESLNVNILHAASDEFFSRLQLASFIREHSRVLHNHSFEEVEFQELVLLEPRSKDSRLDNTLIKHCLGYDFEDLWSVIARKVAIIDSE
jgi:dTDP-4-dehydrorhamnose reductase